MSTKRNTTDEFAEFLFLDLKAVNNFKKRADTARVLPSKQSLKRS
jgi:hypothetical protein